LPQALPFSRRLSLAIGKRTPVRPVRSKLREAVASLSFDDVPQTATQAGADVMEQAGVRGSYYVCGSHTGGAFEGRAQHELADLVRLREAGHEIGCHTYAHQDATLVGHGARRRDHAANQAFAAEALGGDRLITFAYPYGSTSFRSKLFYSRRFMACRGVFAGLNVGVIDLAELRAVPIESHAFDISRVRALAAEAKDRAAWLIFFTHDVQPEPSPYGCRREELDQVVGALADAGIEVLPVREAAARVLAG
jgi:peptidoglycan/xylan/chitin deacetylase (PgdA/CDA1 family)